MPTVVIIHAADDTLPARALAEKVRQAKLEVVLEKTGDELRSALSSATLAIALWSPRSTAQPELAEHASFAKGKTKLIHATMQSAPAPEPFRNEPAVNLTGWRGEDDFPAWRELAAQVTQKAGVAPLPPPTPKPPSGFFQPGVVAPAAQGAPAAPAAKATGPRQAPAQPRQQAAPRPQPTAPRPAPAPRAERAPEPAAEKKGGGGMLIAIIAVVVLLLAGGGGYWFMTQNNAGSAYESVDATSVSALREFLAGDPSTADRERAEAALAQLEEAALSDARAANTIEAWEAFLRDFPNSDEAVYAQGQIQQLRLQQNTAPPPLGPDGQPLPLGPDGQPLPVDPNAPPATTVTPPATTPTTPPATGPTTISPPPAEEPPPEEPPSATPTP
ncbi:MAG TPA: hypothetical protein VEA80_16520 [Vitreimonas sp.]|uniref:hypothetical protein n=1 Tax=Vitreimonas sp. TaxID=3069702 RepID=UPI002D3D0D69|nr:hypothetical protein [Vitreimonas sp.]HYD89083.1 hypothetical protein [Vitreimonas sp.]